MPNVFTFCSQAWSLQEGLLATRLSHAHLSRCSHGSAPVAADACSPHWPQWPCRMPAPPWLQNDPLQGAQSQLGRKWPSACPAVNLLFRQHQHNGLVRAALEKLGKAGGGWDRKGHLLTKVPGTVDEGSANIQVGERGVGSLRQWGPLFQTVPPHSTPKLPFSSTEKGPESGQSPEWCGSLKQPPWPSRPAWRPAPSLPGAPHQQTHLTV